MNPYYELYKSVSGSVRVAADKVEVVDLEALRAKDIDILVRDAVFGTDAVKDYARWLIWELGQTLDARPASINDFYMSRATGAWKDRTVPAMNIRFTTYDTARAAFRARYEDQHGRLRLRNRPQRNGLHGSAARRVQRPPDRRRHQGRLPRPASSSRAITSRSRLPPTPRTRKAPSRKSRT